jgi:hypothetical protein
MPDYSIKRIIDWYTKKLKECKGAFVSVSIDDLNVMLEFMKKHSR